MKLETSIGNQSAECSGVLNHKIYLPQHLGSSHINESNDALCLFLSLK